MINFRLVAQKYRSLTTTKQLKPLSGVNWFLKSVNPPVAGREKGTKDEGKRKNEKMEKGSCNEGTDSLKTGTRDEGREEGFFGY